eukprot:scaffold32610_cov29-Phaeocystis_antarctica.AAC.1
MKMKKRRTKTNKRRTMYFSTLSRRRLPPTLRPPPRDPRDRRVLSPHSCPHRGQPGRKNAAPASGVVVGVGGG